MSIAQKSQRGTIHPTSEEAGILCPRTPSFLNIQSKRTAYCFNAVAFPSPKNSPPDLRL